VHILERLGVGEPVEGVADRDCRNCLGGEQKRLGGGDEGSNPFGDVPEHLCYGVNGQYGHLAICEGAGELSRTCAEVDHELPARRPEVVEEAFHGLGWVRRPSTQIGARPGCVAICGRLSDIPAHPLSVARPPMGSTVCDHHRMSPGAGVR
jgi:hypothetical protein